MILLALHALAFLAAIVAVGIARHQHLAAVDLGEAAAPTTPMPIVHLAPGVH